MQTHRRPTIIHSNCTNNHIKITFQYSNNKLARNSSIASEVSKNKTSYHLYIEVQFKL